MLKKQNKIRTESQILSIPQGDILPNPNQPRKRFDYDELEGLAQSIRANGILQPLIVRALENGKYELVAGERRLRAAIMAGFSKVPCIVMKCSDNQSAVFALIENIQRADLNMFEEAQAIKKLILELQKKDTDKEAIKTKYMQLADKEMYRVKSERKSK